MPRLTAPMPSTLPPLSTLRTLTQHVETAAAALREIIRQHDIAAGDGPHDAALSQRRFTTACARITQAHGMLTPTPTPPPRGPKP